MMTHSRIWSTVAAAGLMTLVSCKKESAAPSGNQFTSLLFDATSPAAREALATPVNFQLTETNYAQWEQAQRFLDEVPRSALASASGATGSAIDRAVETLEASPRARTAIERTGLSAREFVLETIALAQAAEAQTGKPPAGATVPPENVQFVQRFQSRMTPRTVARGTPPRTGTYNGADTSSAGAQAPTNDQEAGAATPESATVERDRGNDSSAQQPKPPPDTARDTIPR